MANPFQPKTAVIEYRPALIDGSFTWYWSLLPLPDEAHAVAHGHGKNRGAAAIEARQQARKHGYRVSSVRIKHNVTEAAARRIRAIMEARQKKKQQNDPDAVDPKEVLSTLPIAYWLVSVEDAVNSTVLDFWTPAFDKDDAVERLRKKGLIKPEPDHYVAAVIEVPKSEYDQYLKWQDEFGVYESVSSEAAKAEEPTEAQAEAGNYKKGHVSLFGMDISIENAKGSTRSGKNKQGKEWSVTMPAHYGYIKGTKGKDKDHIDVYIGPNEKSEKVFVVNQQKEEGGFDEHKCMICFDDRKKAIAAYDKAFTGDLGPKLRQSVVSTTMDKFKKWLESGDTKKPFKSLVESLLESDPDEISAHDYIDHAFNWTKFLAENGFELFNWETGQTQKQYAKYVGNYMILVADWKRDTGTIDIQFFQSTGKAWAFIEDELVPPAMVEITVKKFIKRAELNESEDPDAVSPKAYIDHAYDWTEYLMRNGFRVVLGQSVPQFLRDIGKYSIVVVDFNRPDRVIDVQLFSKSKESEPWRNVEAEAVPAPMVEVKVSEWLRRAELGESEDPDSVDPKTYLNRVQFQCRYSFDVDLPGDENYSLTVDLPLYPPPETELDDFMDDPTWLKDFYKKLVRTGFPSDDLPWVVEVQYRGSSSHMTESEDPDAIDPKEFLHQSFPSVPANDVMWFLDSQGARAVRIEHGEDSAGNIPIWEIVGIIYATYRGALTKLNRTIRHFNLPLYTELALDRSGVAGDDQTHYNRRFRIYLPRYALTGPSRILSP